LCLAPTIGFEKKNYAFKETDGIVQIPLVREGDISQEVYVICYTRQGSASVVDDFAERPKTYSSLVKFKRNEKVKNCNV